MKIIAACTLAGAIALSVSPAFAQTRVACVGDSITYGYGLQSGEKPYPADLQDKLGSDFNVQNFGENGSTAQKGTDGPYWDREKFRTSSEFDPQIVVLMLGSNDTKATNWNVQRFETDYVALAEHYRALGANVVMVTPPPVTALARAESRPRWLGTRWFRACARWLRPRMRRWSTCSPR